MPTTDKKKKKKTFTQSKTKLKKVISAIFFVTVSKVGTIGHKANARTCNNADRSNSKIK